MKIIHIIPSLSKGGAERLVLDICNELTKKEGVEVKLITFTSVNEYSFLTQNINWEIIPASISLSLTKKNKFYIDILQKAIEDFKPDIIHTHLFEAEIVSRSCCYPQAKWFSHGHDNMVQFKNLSLTIFENKKNITNFYEKQYLIKNYQKNGVNHFIAISNDTKQYFEDTISSFPVTLLHNAIDYTRFYKGKNKSIENSTIELVNIGSFLDKKNQAFLIDVVEVLLKRNCKVVLNLLGDGINRSLIESKIKEKKLENLVILRGNVNNVEEYLWQSDIYVHSATYEPLGLVLIEAMAAGLPVITLDGKGNRDLIVEGKNGYMLYTHNAEEFSDKIIELWQNRDIYAKISLFAQNYSKNFDIKEYVDKLLTIYQT